MRLGRCQSESWLRARRRSLRVAAGGLAALGECRRGRAERRAGSDWASLVLPGSQAPRPRGPPAPACPGAGRASLAAHLRSEVTPRRAPGWQVPQREGPAGEPATEPHFWAWNRPRAQGLFGPV